MGSVLDELIITKRLRYIILLFYAKDITIFSLSLFFFQSFFAFQQKVVASYGYLLHTTKKDKNNKKSKISLIISIIKIIR